MKHKNIPVLTFKTETEFGAWLKKNHGKSEGVWLRFYKKASRKKAIKYKEALDVALSWGWIDSLVNKFDEESYLQKFTPRRSRSIWSQRNRDHIARLIEERRMQPEGLREVEAAKEDGRWAAAYASPANTKMPTEFLRQLKKNKTAAEFFKTLNKANTYAIAWRINEAKKPETKKRRIKNFIEMLSRREKLH